MEKQNVNASELALKALDKCVDHFGASGEFAPGEASLHDLCMVAALAIRASMDGEQGSNA